MENLKQELLKIAQNWNASGEYDQTEFEGRYFISDDDLDEFAAEHNLTNEDGNFDEHLIQRNCNCQIIYDYKSSNLNRQFGDQEIIFN